MLSDLDIGMNDWVVPRLKWDGTYTPNRGRVLSAQDLERIPKFLRYTNEDENFVPARTLPGVDSKGSYFVRGSGHNKFGGYTEIPDEYQEVMDRLLKKHSAAAKFVPAPIIEKKPGAKFGLVAMGGCDPAMREAIDILDRQGIPADYMRIRGFPFAEEVEQFLESHPFNFIVEQNRDAQLKSLLVLETGIAKDKLKSLLIYGGFPLSASHVVEPILKEIA